MKNDKKYDQHMGRCRKKQPHFRMPAVYGSAGKGGANEKL